MLSVCRWLIDLNINRRNIQGQLLSQVSDMKQSKKTTIDSELVPVSSGSCPVCGQLLSNSNEFTEAHKQIAHQEDGGLAPVIDEQVPVIDEQVIECPRCETLHHKECWDYNDGCAIYGCKASLVLAREAAQIEIATSEGFLPEVTVAANVKQHFLNSVHFLSMLSEVHWYVGGVSLTGSCIMLLAKFVGLPTYGGIPYYAIIRTVAFVGLLFGFMILLLARFLPAFLKSFGTYGLPYQIKLPSDYTPKEIDALVTTECKNVNTLELAGFLHYSQGSFERASELFMQALAIDEEHQNCRYQLGRCFAKLGEMDAALEQFHHGWEINKISGLGKKSRWWAELTTRRIANGEAEVVIPAHEKKFLK